MHYFVTSRIDSLTSAIELAEIKRLNIFKSLNISAKILTLEYSRYQQIIWKDLNIDGAVLNPIAYLQKLCLKKLDKNDVIKKILSDDKLTIKENEGFIDQKIRIKIVEYKNEIDYVTYFDRWGFTDRRDFYVSNRLSYTEYFDDGGKLVTRTYYNCKEIPFLIYHYRGGAGNVPVLTLIQLNHLDHWYQFDQEVDFRAYFLDYLSQKDPDIVFYSDREDYALEPFELMKLPAKRYVILHSAFTENSQAHGKPFPYIKKMFTLGKKIDGVICSTQQETLDLQKRPEMKVPCYTIPVSYLENELLMQENSFQNRIPGQLIAVARLTSVKQLDHLINAVVLVHQKIPFVDLKIYGYNDNWQNYETSTRLHKLVKDCNANKYIHFCGYRANLSTIYQTADIEILTSAYEGFSMAVLEALGYGCPVVSYDINYGPKELIKNNKTGNLIPAGDAWSLQKTLLHLLSNRDTLKYYGLNTKQTLSDYSRTNVTKKWLGFINGINSQ
ncbi:glycosyltransferase [Pediococcus stilesii]|uniref:Glycosyl transferase family 1 domain-containing protein n=1 Tax=Pediococcus stilesii TaxID=331679 RepID=A0A0R2KS39_9LACO|nr:glycosyltransferase [Pediococcus stilesii]KRN92387.1 hypothetical protein IV81_GL001171 [Pediococcus stilesii]